jgi:lipopolysaccharide transport system permease protein
VPEAGVIQDAVTIWKFRYFWLSLVKMDLVTRYRKSVLGIFWSLLQPIGMTAIFCLVFSKLNQTQWDTFSKYLMAGLVSFGFLRDCTLGGCHSLTRHEGYIRQAPLPFAVYSLRVMLTSAIHFLISLVVVVVLVAVLPPVRMKEGIPERSDVNWRDSTVDPAATPDPAAPPTIDPVNNGDWDVFARVWMILPALVLSMACGWALATVTGYITVYFHDIAHLLELGAQALIFATPVMWLRHLLVPPGSPHAWMVDYNPASAFVDLFRLPLVYAEWPTPLSFAVAGVTTALMVVLAWVLSARLSKRVIFQM